MHIRTRMHALMFSYNMTFFCNRNSLRFFEDPEFVVCCSLCNAVCPFSTRLLVAFHPPQKKPVNMCEWLNLTLNVVTLSHENILKRLYCLNVLTEVSGSGLLLTLIVHCNLLQAIRSL